MRELASIEGSAPTFMPCSFHFVNRTINFTYRPTNFMRGSVKFMDGTLNFTKRSLYFMRGKASFMQRSASQTHWQRPFKSKYIHFTQWPPIQPVLPLKFRVLARKWQ